jgi:hypothetical protein
MSASLPFLRQIVLAGLVAAGVVLSGPDGGNHHPRTAAQRCQSWAIMTASSWLVLASFSGVRRRLTIHPAPRRENQVRTAEPPSAAAFSAAANQMPLTHG